MKLTVCVGVGTLRTEVLQLLQQHCVHVKGVFGHIYEAKHVSRRTESNAVCIPQAEVQVAAQLSCWAAAGICLTEDRGSFLALRHTLCLTLLHFLGHTLRHTLCCTCSDSHYHSASLTVSYSLCL